MDTEQLLRLVNAVGSLLTGGGLGVLSYLFFFDSKRRTENARAKQSEAEARKAEEENITSYAEEWRQLYEQRDKRVQELNDKVDRLYRNIEDDRQRIRALTEENTRLKLDGVTYRCERLECPKRVPPNAYTPKDNAAGGGRPENGI